MTASIHDICSCLLERKQPFTAYNITKALREVRGPGVRIAHDAVRKEVMAWSSQEVDVDRTMHRFTTGAAIIYHHRDQDAQTYVDMNQADVDAACIQAVRDGDARVAATQAQAASHVQAHIMASATPPAGSGAMQVRQRRNALRDGLHRVTIPKSAIASIAPHGFKTQVDVASWNDGQQVIAVIGAVADLPPMSTTLTTIAVTKRLDVRFPRKLLSMFTLQEPLRVEVHGRVLHIVRNP
jgi:hypothetical protein